MRGLVVGCNSEQGPMCSDIDILGTRCKENRAACWSLELCYLQGCRRGE